MNWRSTLLGSTKRLHQGRWDCQKRGELSYSQGGEGDVGEIHISKKRTEKTGVGPVQIFLHVMRHPWVGSQQLIQ